MKLRNRDLSVDADLRLRRATGVGRRGSPPSLAARLKVSSPGQSRYPLRSSGGSAAGHSPLNTLVPSNAGGGCSSRGASAGYWAAGSTPTRFRCRVRLSPVRVAARDPSSGETSGEGRGSARSPSCDPVLTPSIRERKVIMKAGTRSKGTCASPRAGRKAGAGRGGLTPSLAWRLKLLSPVQRRYFFRSTKGRVLRGSLLRTPLLHSNGRDSSPCGGALAGAWGAGLTPKSLRCRVRMSPSWRRTLALPSKGEGHGEVSGSATDPSPGPGVASVSDCLYPGHLLAQEMSVSSSRGPVLGLPVAGLPTMTSGAKGHGDPEEHTRFSARFSDGQPAVWEQRPVGLDESMPGVSGSGHLGVLSPQGPSVGLVRESGDPGGSGVASFVVRLPDLDPCGTCGTRVGTPAEMAEHLRRAHGVVSILWACRECGLTRSNRHRISCHLPKCRGPVARGSFPCEHCPRAFLSARGRSQHMLRAHAAAYHGERLARGGGDRRGPGSRPRRPEEVNKPTPRRRAIPSARLGGVVVTDPGVGGHGGLGRSKCRLPRRAVRKRGRVGQLKVSEGDRLREVLVTPSTPPTPQRTVKDALLEVLHAVEEGRADYGAGIPVTEGDCSQEAIASASSNMARKIGRKVGSGRSGRSGPVGRSALGAGRRSESRRRARRFLFRLYRTDRAKLASLVLDGQTGQECPVPLSEVAAVFEGRWGDVRPFRGLGQFDGLGRADNSVFCRLISPVEVMKNLRAVKNRSSPGPDGVTKAGLLAWDPNGEKLAHMFSTWLVSGTLPRVFKKCRTALIPKTTEQGRLGDVNQWRPITIGSMVLRLFSRILTARMVAACPTHPRQRGFIASPGCSENLVILDGIMKLSKSEKFSLGVVFVDFAKAFDTVSHEHLLSALERKGLDQHMLELVRNSYENCVTRVRCAEGDTAEIAMKVGVKQGDSMSPLLFNLALDPLIQTLEREGRGFAADGKSLTAMAFADDLVLLSDSWDGMEVNIAILETFCELTGLSVQPSKCHGFFVETVGRVRSVNGRPPWLLGGSPLHLIGPDEGVRYLGVRINPWTGIVLEDNVGRIREWITSISQSPLGPIEKVTLLVDYALPRVIFAADHCMLPATALTEMDGHIRQAVKNWLHLPTCTADGLLYSRKSSGGLGIPKLARVVPSIQARRIHKLFHSSDEIVRWISHKTIQYQVFKRAWLKAGGSLEEIPSLYPPAEGEGLGVGSSPVAGSPAEGSTETPGLVRPKRRLVPCDWRQVEFDRWAELKSQGKGVRAFEADKVSNSWLMNPYSGGFTPGRFIAALQLRANVYPTRESAVRGRQTSLDVLCRYCRGSPETCSHILGACPMVRDSRIRRHHKVCDLVVARAQRLGWSVEREKRWTVPSGAVLAPDFVCTKADQALIVDVTIRYELKEDSLEVARLEKVTKYRPLIPVLLRELAGVRRVRVFGLPVGARGKWPAFNGTFLRALGLQQSLRRGFAELISRRTLLYSLDVLRDFMAGEGR